MNFNSEELRVKVLSKDDVAACECGYTPNNL